MTKFRKRWTGKILIVVWGVFLSLVIILPPAGAAPMSSQNYRITVDVLGGGGNRSTSVSYINQSTIAQVGVVGSKLTSASGLEAFCGFWPATEIEFALCLASGGDINNDTNLTPEDALMVLQHYLGVIQLEGCRQDSADINGDGFITPADAMCIYQEHLGLDSCLE